MRPFASVGRYAAVCCAAPQRGHEYSHTGSVTYCICFDRLKSVTLRVSAGAAATWLLRQSTGVHEDGGGGAGTPAPKPAMRKPSSRSLLGLKG